MTIEQLKALKPKRAFQITEETGEQLAQWLASAKAEQPKPDQKAILQDLIASGEWDEEQLKKWKLDDIESLTPEKQEKAVAFLRYKMPWPFTSTDAAR